MTFAEAQNMLATAPRSDNPSRINKHLTENQAVVIVGEYIGGEIDKGNAAEQLDYLMEKRVRQVCLKQIRPKMS